MCMTCAMGGYEIQQVLHEGEAYSSPVTTVDPTATTGLTVNEGADAAASTSTAYSMSVGDTFNGSIGTAYDQDWVAVTFSAGQFIQINQTGLGLSDTYLRLYDSSGTLVASNDDANGSLNSQIDYAVSTGGTYYVSAGAFSSNTGSYSMTVVDVPPPPPADPLDAITWGSQLSSTSVDVYFGAAGYTGDGVTSEGFNAYQIAQFMAVFDLLESVSGLTFNIVDTAAAADFRLVMDTNQMSSGSYGRMNPPGYASGADAGVGVFNQNAMGSAAGGPMDMGGLGWYVIVHELLHGLGMAHPHDRGGNGTGNDSTIMDGVSSSSDTGDYALNQGHYTIMSYNWEFDSGVGTAGDPYLWGMAAGPGALDIAVLQSLYGANATHNSGADTYTLGDVHGAGAHWHAIWDTGSVDSIRYVGTRDATIDLRAATLDYENGGGGFNSAVAGVAGGYTIANGVVIERAYGDAGDDTLQGNSVDNLLNAGAGNDEVHGRGGHDKIYGQDGDDTITGGLGNDTIAGGNDNDDIDGGSGDDTLKGGGGEDTIVGGNDNDAIYGQGAADSLEGGSGADFINAGGGSDVLWGESGADSLRAGSGNDTVYGNAGDDTINGGSGRDLLNGGNDNDSVFGSSGNDTIRGGSGNDTLDGGTFNDELDGGDNNDTLIGGAGRDTLMGGDGDDTLNGGSGTDTLDGGPGDDTLTGGGDADTFVFDTGYGSNLITDFQVRTDILQLDAALVGSATTGQQVIDTYGSVSGDDVTLTLADGTVIDLIGANRAAFADDIVIV